jgi:hypothetical protein
LCSVELKPVFVFLYDSRPAVLGFLALFRHFTGLSVWQFYPLCGDDLPSISLQHHA